MASGSCSSSAVPTLKWKYDAFLSFRGEDTRCTFLDHLHTALLQKGIFVFKDDEELKTGEPISLELLKAIQESRYAVVVFSKKYANSSWCLAELAKIMECHKELGQKVIPVFYHVDPSDIRGQKNQVAVFFQQHEERFRQELDKVKEWRDALTAAANLSGFHISETFKEGESSYIRKIIEEISADIQLPYTESDLVGISSHIAALNSLLKTEENEEVRIVGIHGMGGIGKTTIAKALFRRIASKFEGSCFVDDVREKSSSKRDLCALQEKVLKEILATNQNFNVQDPEDGANMIQARFVKRKVLMVLDDVDDFEQLEALSATHDSFGPGSRIIITTRNKQLLFGANAEYEPGCLQMHEALELFSRHAFKRDSPPEGYEELSRRAINYAGCLPLAVKVLGSFFREREANVWESALNRQAKAPNDKIFASLKLSYDGLEDSEQKIFLDIACFFKGEYVSDVTKVLESCDFDPVIGISVLIEKSLITISDDEVIDMHDLIQEMGWKIVRESFPNSRLWKLEDIHDSIKDNQNLKKIEAIVMSHKQYDIKEYEEKVGFSANVFKHMKNLRLLDIRGRFTSSEPTFFPDNLRWLSWSRYPFSSLSITHMRKLVHLNIVGGAIKQFWNGQKIMPNLKIVKLEGLDYLTTIPDVSGAPNIEELKVSNCKNLVEFHESLGYLKRIITLEVTDCKRLKSLPSRFEMESLESLEVKNCSSLERFPDLSPCMVKLSSISLGCCSSIEGLLSSLGYLSSLDYLNLRRDDTKALETQSKSISLQTLTNLFSLRILSESISLQTLANLFSLRILSKSISLQTLTNLLSLESQSKSICLQTLTNLCSLRVLNLSGRPMESEFFLRYLQSFSSLFYLDLSGNNNLIQIPATISHLSFLKWLLLNECHQLQIIQGLPSGIRILEANNCYSLEKIDDLSQEEYDCWDNISLVNCEKLVKDEDSKTYLERMFLRRSFFKRCAVMDRDISIVIPGNKIPRWFKEEEAGGETRVMIPPNCNKHIIGIAICVVFPPVEQMQREYIAPFVRFKFKKADGVSFPKNQSHIPNAVSDSVLAGKKGNMWLCYRPTSTIRRFQDEDWSEGGTLLLSVSATPIEYEPTIYLGAKPVRCAACVIQRRYGGIHPTKK